MIARLAEALDHASSRDVTHGDVKPSNILLSADGNPMLLDFNLARDGAAAVDPSGRPVDPGGTLAYMAPERLRALVGADPASASASAGASTTACPGPGTTLPISIPTSPAASRRPAAREAQAADIYSLGMVLLEALDRPAADRRCRSRGRGFGVRPRGRSRLISTARAYAAARERPARVLVRDFEAASGRRIAPALRAILGRCLDPDPARRYGRALELAEDLDRWRTDRPLAYADEPFWGQAVPRWLRVKRRTLIVAAGLFLAFGLSVYALLLRDSNRLLHRDLGRTRRTCWRGSGTTPGPGPSSAASVDRPRTSGRPRTCGPSRSPAAPWWTTRCSGPATSLPRAIGGLATASATCRRPTARTSRCG